MSKHDLRQPSVLVVGAGAIGVALAAELVSRGHLVTVVDAAECGTGTTAATYGWVNANSKRPASYAGLNRMGLRAHERWSTQHGRPWFHQIGNLQIVHDIGRMAELEQEAIEHRATGYPVQLLTSAEATALEPGIDGTGVVGGALFSAEGWADSALMCSVLMDHALAGGARYLPYHRVIELDAGGAVVRGPGSTTTRISADITVLAAGNGTRQLVNGLGLEFPVLPTALDAQPDGSGNDEHPTVGMTCTTGPVEGLPRHMIQTDGVSFRPSPNGGVTITDHPTASRWDGDDRWTAPEDLLSRATRLCPALGATDIALVNVGHRVLPNDGLTIADWLDQERRIYTIATHSGITLAPHLAETVATELGTGERDPSLADFGLDRFGNLPAAPAR